MKIGLARLFKEEGFDLMVEGHELRDFCTC